MQARRSAAQMGARARTILSALAENRPGRAERRDPSQAFAPNASPANDRAERDAAPVAGGVPAVAPQTEPVPVERPSKIVPLPGRERRPAPKGDAPPAHGQKVRPVASKPKRGILKISAILAIGLPTALSAIYFGFIAAPQYVAETKFAVRGPEDAPATGNLIGQITGLNSAALVSSESFIVQQFIESQHLVENLQKSLDLRTIYTNDKADFLARYSPYAADDAAEHLTRFWNTVASVYYEPISGIISFKVRAFTPEDALKIARETIRESERLVNKLTARSREDAIFDTKQELSRAELRLKFARQAIQEYRNREGAVDPSKSADAQLMIMSGLEGDLAKQEAEMASALSFLSADAPTVRVMRNRIAALKARVAAERSKIGSTAQVSGEKRDRPLLSSSLAEFETLDTERQFAEKAYESALISVENAKIRAERQTRYLATFVEPQLPQDSMYPLRTRSVLLVLLCSAIAWAIGVLIFYGIRDHAA